MTTHWPGNDNKWWHFKQKAAFISKQKKNNPARNFLKVRYTFKFYSGMEGRICVKKYLFLLLKGLGGSSGYLIDWQINYLIPKTLDRIKNFKSDLCFFYIFDFLTLSHLQHEPATLYLLDSFELVPPTWAEGCVLWIQRIRCDWQWHSLASSFMLPSTHL